MHKTLLYNETGSVVPSDLQYIFDIIVSTIYISPFETEIVPIGTAITQHF